jgi:hypothetical protein
LAHDQARLRVVAAEVDDVEANHSQALNLTPVSPHGPD